MALRRKPQPTPITDHLMAFMLKHEEVIARLDKQLRELTQIVEGLTRTTETRQAVTPASTPTVIKAKATRQKSKSPKHNKVYSADEIALALMLREQGATYRQIGAALNRSAGAIERLMNTRLKKGDTNVRPRNTTRGAR